MGQQQARISIKEGYTEKFGKVEYIIPTYGEKEIKIVVRMQTDTTQTQYKNWRNKMQWINAQQYIVDLIFLPLTLKHLNCFLCTATNKAGQMQITYPKINHSLSEVIRHRKSIGRHFTEPELWYLLYVLIKVAAFLEKNHQSLGNIHPLNVIINQYNRIQLFTQFSSPSELTNLEKLRLSHHHDVYLAPQQAKLINKDYSVNCRIIDKNKVDTFDIGLVLLSTILLKDCYHLYSRSLFELNQEKLSQYKDQIKKIGQKAIYSYHLLDLVGQLLSIDSFSRKAPSFYFKTLKRYEKMILQLQDFKFEKKQDDYYPTVDNELGLQQQVRNEKKYLSLMKTKRKNEYKTEKQEISQQPNVDDTLSKRLFK